METKNEFNYMDKLSKIDVVVLTTAIDRPELHQNTFSKYLSYIGNVNIHWVITINNIQGRLQETENELLNTLNSFPVHIKTFETGGTKLDWFNSVKYCINYAKLLNPSIGYFWLEDDWGVKTGSLAEDLQLIVDETAHVSLADRTEVSFNPSLWGHKSFDTLMYNSINSPELSPGKRYMDGKNTNPERICCPFPESKQFVKLHRVNRFYDVGRDWQRKNIIRNRTFDIKTLN